MTSRNSNDNNNNDYDYDNNHNNNCSKDKGSMMTIPSPVVSSPFNSTTASTPTGSVDSDSIMDDSMDDDNAQPRRRSQSSSGSTSSSSCSSSSNEHEEDFDEEDEDEDQDEDGSALYSFHDKSKSLDTEWSENGDTNVDPVHYQESTNEARTSATSTMTINNFMSSLWSSTNSEQDQQRPSVSTEIPNRTSSTTTSLRQRTSLETQQRKTKKKKRIGSEITLLGEIIGARDLRVHDEDQLASGVDDINRLRVYAVVKYDNRKIHRTSNCSRDGPNPIFSPSTKSLFLLRTTAREISRSTINISLYSKKTENALPVSLVRSSSIFLGQVNLDATTILDHCDEERIEFTLEDEIGEETSNLGHLAVRFRVATPSDIDVVAFFNKKQQQQQQQQDALQQATTSTSHFVAADDPLNNSTNDNIKRNSMTTKFAPNPFQRNSIRPVAPLVTETSEAEIAQTGFVNALSSVFARNVITDSETGVRKVRIKPGPDPDRVQETEYMSCHDIHVNTRLPSLNWIEAGSGSLGKLYVEVLSCHDLPNTDVGESMGNLTDSFCALVYEDCCCMTDVIDDELSPHWLPWTKRAFAFNMMHPASTLYLGVFDYDLGIGEHEAIGRVAVNVCNLQRDTIHTLKYNLYPSSNVTDRTANGSITIRLRVEWYDERQALLTALKPRPKMHINVTKQKSFRVIRYCCFGEFDNEEQFDLTVTRSLINECFAYKRAMSYLIGDTLRSLMFWRGQVEIFSVMLPVHSMLFFVMATRLVERPSLIVPFTLLGVAWALIAMATVRRQDASPWNRCPSFIDGQMLLLTGKSSTPIQSIKENEGAEASRRQQQEWQKRIDDDLKLAEKKQELEQEVAAIGDENIHTQVPQGVIPLDLLLRLARYQGIIRRLCDKFRFIKIIATWEDSVISFWLTTAFLAVGLVSLILPWGFILHWSGRIFVWGVFGPHMKLVDLTIRARSKNDDSLGALLRNMDIQKNLARRRRERALKIQDIKQATFGQFSVQIPSFNLARHFDRPLPESSGRVCRKNCRKRSRSRLSVVNVRDTGPWIPGQQLYGGLIPRPVYDLSVYEREAVLQEESLRTFRRRVDRIKDAKGILHVAQKELAKLGHVEGSPMAFGYEVALDERSQTVDTDNNNEEQHRPFDENNLKPPKKRLKSLALGARVTVKLTSDKRRYVSTREMNQLVLQSDGLGTYCISEDGEESGLEVIGLGRFSTEATVKASKSFEQELRQSNSGDSLVGAYNHELEQVFTCPDNVHVALYRPLDCVVNASEKQKEE